MCKEVLTLSSAIIPKKKKKVEYWKLLTFKHVSLGYLHLTTQSKVRRFDCY